MKPSDNHSDDDPSDSLLVLDGSAPTFDAPPASLPSEGNDSLMPERRPSLAASLRPVFGPSLDVSDLPAGTRIFELDIELDKLTVPDLEALVSKEV